MLQRRSLLRVQRKRKPPFWYVVDRKAAVRRLVATVVLLALLWVALPYLLNLAAARTEMERQLSAALGRRVQLGSFRFTPLSGGVTADNLTIADDSAFDDTPFVTSDAVRFRLDLLPLLVREISVRSVTFVRPNVRLMRNASGQWNYASLFTATLLRRSSSGGKPVDFAAKLVRIVDGHVTIGHLSDDAQPLILNQVSLDVRDFDIATAFPVAFTAAVSGGGKLKGGGRAGPLKYTPFGPTLISSIILNVSSLDLAGAGFNDVAPGLGGIVSFDATTESDGEVARIDGHLRGKGMKFSRQALPSDAILDVEFALEHNFPTHSGIVTRAVANIGEVKRNQAHAEASGRYAEHRNTIELDMEISQVGSPLSPLGGLLPATGMPLPDGTSLQGGIIASKMKLSGTLEQLTIAGVIDIDNTVLKAFDLSKRMSAVPRLVKTDAGADTPIEAFHMDFTLGPAGVDVRQVRIGAPGAGQFSGSGNIGPTGTLDFNMKAVWEGDPMGAAAPVPFTVSGICSDPVFSSSPTTLRRSVQ